MTYNRKWKPSASQRRAFAERMQDPNERAEYEALKQAKADKRRATSKFSYESAGGEYVPTEHQFNEAQRLLLAGHTEPALEMVVYGYNCKEKIHHDHIHILNELLRSGK